MSFFKKKSKIKDIKAFVSGEVIPIEDVNDPVFSSKALGEGIAIYPTEQTIVAPCEAKISMISQPSNHALGLSLNNGAEILLHIGLDTVNLKGQGFQLFVKEGDSVKEGEKLLTFDKNFIEQEGFETTCIFIVTNSADFPQMTFFSGMQAKKNQTVICKF